MTPDVIDRFVQKVDVTPGCWQWTAHIDKDGYGSFKYQGRNYGAHRVAWLLAVGEIPDGLTIDHLCRVRHCVNPDHLEPVTVKVNTMRGLAPSAAFATATHCIHGHAFDEANTIRYTHRGRSHRRCRVCQLATKRRWRARQR